MAITPCRDKWKGTMTDRERFNNQMHYKPIDRCFNVSSVTGTKILPNEIFS